MAGVRPLVPRSGREWKPGSKALSETLEDKAPRFYDVTLAPDRRTQTSPANDAGQPFRWFDVIESPFEVKGGRLLVRLTRVAYLNLRRVVDDVSSIEVGFGRAALASRRTFGMQSMLFQLDLKGGPLAAPPGKTWHDRAAVDMGVRDDAGQKTMLAHGFMDLLPQDPPHFTFGRRG